MVATSEMIALADPLMDVRDVLETFRTHDLVVRDWRDILADAADGLDQQPWQIVGDLATRLRVLVASGLRESPEAVHKVANVVAHLLEAHPVDHVPQPGDHHWGFDE